MKDGSVYYKEEEEEECYEEEEFIPWITWFCELKGHEFFCEVDKNFISDEFNLTGLASMVSFYHYAIELILDRDTLDGGGLTVEQRNLVESSAETLYGLIHARYITTLSGLAVMARRYVDREFGVCPRVFCCSQGVLPVGLSDIVRESSMKLYCPKCEDVYNPRSVHHRSLDGAFWGTTFPHLLLMHIRDSTNQASDCNEQLRGQLREMWAKPKSTQQYTPRIYGFRIRKVPPSGDVLEGMRPLALEDSSQKTPQVAAAGAGKAVNDAK